MIFSDSAKDADLLEQLAQCVENLGRSRLTPEEFHVAKNLCAHDMRRLADRMRANARPERAPTWTWKPPYDV